MLEKLRSEVELVARHLEVVRVVAENQPIGIMKLAEMTGEPSHRIRYSLKVLESQGYIRASPSGAVVTEAADEMLAHFNEEIDTLIALLEEMRDGKGT
ncbi:hypothetical protein AZH53_09680 [Methanomicrobiaceae archaeon CYW5]|uniref:hypothetical protein n=1 Tax=Methanovulcanius yangii TaxID=1789227 RepID=UPI0029CA3081|nr:hypothetical protein [Methanovulcanius yangii]MBT8508673.1 hypothetical protein [Methanovulcanius yangii]